MILMQNINNSTKYPIMSEQNNSLTPPTKSTIPFIVIIENSKSQENFPPEKHRRHERKKVKVLFQIYDTKDEKGMYSISGPCKISKGTIQIRGGGHAYVPKKSFSIRLTNKKGKKKMKSLMGMPKSDQWVLKSNSQDHTHLINKLAYDIYEEMGHYAPKVQFVQVYFKSHFRTLESNGYWGLYSFESPVKRKGDKHVPTVHKNKGGFIIKQDHSRHSPTDHFSTIHNAPFKFRYPSFQSKKRYLLTEIKNRMDRCEKALMKGENWREYIDEKALIDYFILVDVFANPDSYYIQKNIYYFLNNNGKIQPIPWDFGWSFGDWNIKEYCCKFSSGSWSLIHENKKLIFGDTKQSHLTDNGHKFYRYPLMQYLIKDQEFVESFKSQYYKLRKGKEAVLSDESMVERIRNTAKPLTKQIQLDCCNNTKSVYELNQLRWPSKESKKRLKCVPLKFTERLKFMDNEVRKLGEKT